MSFGKTMRYAAFILGLAIIFPVAAADMPDVDIPYDSFVLDNGLRVIVHEDRKAPIVAVSVWYHVGSKDEPTGKTGFAHLFEHLMFNGSENYDGEFFEPLQEVGGTDMNGTTSLDRTNYFETVPTPALERVLFLESDRMGHLLGAVTQEKLDNQRDVVQNEKRQGENQPYGRVFNSLQKGVFPIGHPYHHSAIGTMEDLNNASLEDVKEWFKTYYGPNNAVLVLAGDINVEEARSLVQHYFGDIPAGPPLTKAKGWMPSLSSNVYEVMEDRVPQARVYRVWATPGLIEKTSAELDVAGQILGSGKTSRLYKDLVYDKQLATSVSAGQFPFELTSLFYIQADVKEGHTIEEVTERIDQLMAEFLAKGPTRAELERAQTGIIAGAVRGLEKVGGFGGKAVTLAESALYANDPAFFKTRLQWIADAKTKDILTAARDWLSGHYFQLDVIPFGQFSAAEEGIDRSAGLPGLDTAPDLDFPSVERAQLSNGMDIVLATRSTVPIVNIALMFDAGFAADHGVKLGTASLTFAMLDEGTKTYSALEIAEKLETLGAELSAGSGLDTSTVRLNTLKTELAASIDLLADVVRNPAFDENELERLRQQALAGIRQEQNQPTGIALRSLPPLMYGEDHIYGMPFTGSGTLESVSAITREDLVAFHQSWIRPDNATLFVVGDTTMPEIREYLEEAFGDWRPASRVDRKTKTLTTVDRPERGRVIIVDRPGSPQSLILAGQVAPPTGVENNIAIETMNDILGGQFTARVNMNLREEKGWAYGAYTFLQDARGQRPFFVYAPVQTDKTAESMAELVKELNAIKDERPATAEELDMAVKNNVRSLPGRFETSASVLGAMLANARFERPLNYQETLKADYEALSLSDIGAAATEIVHPDQLIWMVIGDREKIEEAVRALDFGDVEIREIAR